MSAQTYEPIKRWGRTWNVIDVSHTSHCETGSSVPYRRSTTLTLYRNGRIKQVTLEGHVRWPRKGTDR